ncbi:LytTR family DNA-binding domain-containing protein [Lacibacter sp. MH-610]|uniref:LytR/AlgR family response regulator transcription factor n=1 Tax=Lacibacter sp. MH-610 TaxID=3020883 RepID=UPI003891B472
MIKAMIVDDEKSSIDLLQWLIQQYCPDITAIKTARSVKEALPLIQSFEPDLLFLDIQMPHESGFDLLTSVEKWSFEVVFTTAYNEFAIQAIRFSALDYLLKPVDEKELQKAVERFKAKRIYASAGQMLFRNFMQNISQGNKEKFKLALADATEIKYVALDEIIRLQAESNYTHIFLRSKSVFVSAKTLKEYDEILSGHHFMRVHKSHLVNPAFIEAYTKSGELQLSDGSVVEVSRRKKEFVQEALKGIGL